MTEKLYYWAENLENYTTDSDQETDYDQVIEIKNLNFFIGKNNAGKSRFLRNLYTSFGFQNFYQSSSFRKLAKLKKDLEKNSTLNDNSRNKLFTNLDQFIGYSGHEEGIVLREFEICLNTLNNFGLLNHFCYNNNIDASVKKFKEELKQKNIIEIDKKIYIPVLRGMRPVGVESDHEPYINRTHFDYFKLIDDPKDKKYRKFNATNIITGECLYQELKIHLLGEPEQRDLIKNYEEKLSQYFFDNEAVSLIPKHNDDVVNIKIGNDRQFPISELGDGLQQVIILTYEAFIKKDATHAFFIEEPELHMHAGMVRQLMNFYLNETNHYYFFTTHSNHLLDMADESDQVIIQKFVKEQNKDDPTKFDFKIYRCDRDRDLLASLGVKPSSVYLANCTIWVEGITDRLYITKYMEKYLTELKDSNSELYKQYRRFMPNYHYTFVEYAGSNLTHWSFSDDYADHLDDKGLSAKAVASEMLLIADGDIQTKPERVKALKNELKKENYFILKCKETENTLPKDLIINVAKSKFSRLKSETTKSYDISLIDQITDDTYFDHNEFGIGKRLCCINIQKLSFPQSIQI